MNEIMVRSRKETPLLEFLQTHNYIVDKLEKTIYRIQRDAQEVFMKIEGNTLYFQVDLGSVQPIAGEKLYFDLLDLNTEILPVSLGIDTVSSETPRLIIVESRESQNLDDNEILSVLEALEIAAVKVELVLGRHIKKNK